MSDLLRHELARRGFFTCSMVIGNDSLYWPTEDWTGDSRKLQIDSKACLILAGTPTGFEDDATALHMLDTLGWLPLADSPVPAHYFPAPAAELA